MNNISSLFNIDPINVDLRALNSLQDENLENQINLGEDFLSINSLRECDSLLKYGVAIQEAHKSGTSVRNTTSFHLKKQAM